MEKEKLKEIVENTISGEWGTEEKKDENDIFVIRTADFFNDGRINYNNVIKRNIAKRKIEEKSLKIGDIIVEKSGGTDKNPVGRVVLFERENYKGLANNFTQVLRIKKEYYYKFIFYQLLYKYKNGSTLQMFNKTTGIQNLQMKLYLNQELNVCDKKEQIKISNLLDKVQEIIDISEKQVEHLDELIKSQFVEMFGMPLENSKNWKVELADDVCLKITDGSHFSPKDEGEGYAMLSVKDMRNDGFHYENCKHVSKESFEILKNQKCVPEINDVLISKDGSYFYYGFVVKENKEEAVLSSIAILKPDIKTINPIFLCNYMLSESIVKYVADHYVTGAALKRVILKGIKKIPVMVPPIELQNKFAKFVEQIDKQKFEIQKSLEEMQLLQESLMNSYFGEM